MSDLPDESGLAGKNLDPFRAHLAPPEIPGYVVGPGSMPQPPQQNTAQPTDGPT
jgi:hypothetical protein